MPNLLAIFEKSTLGAIFIGCLLLAGNCFAQGGGVGNTPQAVSPVQAGAARGAPASNSPDNIPAASDSSLAQSAVQPAPIAEDARYRAFFKLIAAIDEFADKLEKEGKPDAAKAWRTHLQRGAGLSEEEGVLMKEIAFDFNQAQASKTVELKAAIAALRIQHAGSVSPQASLTPELAQLEADRQQILNSHLDQLKSQLGAQSFSKLDAYTQDLFKASTTVPLPDAALQVPPPKGGAQ
jgi:hypothetical protein